MPPGPDRAECATTVVIDRLCELRGDAGRMDPEPPFEPSPRVALVTDLEAEWIVLVPPALLVAERVLGTGQDHRQPGQRAHDPDPLGEMAGDEVDRPARGLDRLECVAAAVDRTNGIKTKVTLNPWVLSSGIGYRF